MAVLNLECKEEFDNRKIEISLREDKHLHRTENVITMYMKTYKFLEPVYFVLKKFLYNMKLCNLSDSSKSVV